MLLIWRLGTNFSEILIEINIFHSRKCIWKCRLENGGQLSRPQCVKDYNQTDETIVPFTTKHQRNGSLIFTTTKRTLNVQNFSQTVGNTTVRVNKHRWCMHKSLIYNKNTPAQLEHCVPGWSYLQQRQMVAIYVAFSTQANMYLSVLSCHR